MDIEEFLAAQRESGEVDSQGVFTVSLEKARQKLGRFQLDDPSFYLLKVVQAAVAGGATRIDLRTSRSKLALWFDAPLPLGRFDELLAIMSDPLRGPDCPLKSLALGFNASLFSDPPQVSFAWWGRGQSQALVAISQELVVTRAPDRPAAAMPAENLYMFSVTKSKRGWFDNATAPEHSAVSTFCSHAPVELRIDGRLVEAGSQMPPRKEPWLETFSDPFLLVERMVPSARGAVRMKVPSLRGRVAGRTGWLRDDRKPDTFCLQPLGDRPSSSIVCQGAYALPLGLRGPDKITFIAHGVKAATVTVNPHGAGATAIVGAAGLSFDLSGFGVMRDQAYHDAVDRVHEVWRELAESVRDDVDKLTGTVMEAERKAAGKVTDQSVTCSGLSCCGMLVAIASFPGLMGDMGFFAVLASMVGGAILPRLTPRDDPHTRLRIAVAERLGKLRDGWQKG